MSGASEASPVVGALESAVVSRNASSKSQEVAMPPAIEPLEMVEGEVSGEGEEDMAYPTGIKFAVIMTALCLVLLLVGLDFNIIATAIPKITDDFKTIADIGWYSAAVRLPLCSFQFMFGKMYSVFSVKWVFLISVAIYEIGSLVCGLAPTSIAFIIARAICGFGGAGIIAGVFVVLTQTVPLHRRPLFGALGGTIETAASIAAPLLGGVLTDKLSWRWCFFINLPTGFITLVVIGLFFQDPQISSHQSLPLKEKIGRLDLPGTVIFVPSITCLLLALQWAGTTYGWANARIIALLIVFGVLAGVFAWHEYRQQDMATLPPRIIGKRSILAGMWFSLCTNSAISIVENFTVKGASPSKSGVLVLPCVIGFIISIMLAGPATSIVGFYTPFMIATSLLMPIGAGLLTTLKVDANLASLISYQALVGFGAGWGLQGPQLAAQTILSQKDAPMGLAVVNFAQNFGPAIMIPAAQNIFTTRLQKLSPGSNSTSLDTMGLSDLKAHYNSSVLGGVLADYDKAIVQTLYLSLALTLLTLLGSLGMEWTSVKKKKA
ncbi:MAG: hypothetical protein M1819_005489 [Sarea resinae]|nr:MAG: hypothetical protein M1819_005489 [Sarea resinae]